MKGAPPDGRVAFSGDTLEAYRPRRSPRAASDGRTLDAVKRRVRAGMGRCQSGFCGPQVIAILARELGIPETEVRKRGVAAYMLGRG